jgi:hypothetical protein
MNNAFKLIKLGCIYQLCYASGSSSVALDSMLISHLDKWFGVSLSKREVLGTHSISNDLSSIFVGTIFDGILVYLRIFVTRFSRSHFFLLFLFLSGFYEILNLGTFWI